MKKTDRSSSSSRWG